MLCLQGRVKLRSKEGGRKVEPAVRATWERGWSAIAREPAHRPEQNISEVNLGFSGKKVKPTYQELETK